MYTLQTIENNQNNTKFVLMDIYQRLKSFKISRLIYSNKSSFKS